MRGVLRWASLSIVGALVLAMLWVHEQRLEDAREIRAMYQREVGVRPPDGVRWVELADGICDELDHGMSLIGVHRRLTDFGFSSDAAGAVMTASIRVRCD